MTENEIYERALKDICFGHPSDIDKDCKRDYDDNEDIPNYEYWLITGEHRPYREGVDDTRLDILHYYLLWFPLVKGDLK